MKRFIGMAMASLICLVAACGSDGNDGKDGRTCTVEQLPNGLHVSCSDGSQGTVTVPQSTADGGVAGSCTVTRQTRTVTITCSDGSSVTFPVATAGTGDGGVTPDAGPTPDGGAASCTVTENGDGSVTIRCPDGSEATLPGPVPADDAGVASSLRLVGATRAACGACHDKPSAKAHFTVMTTEVDGQLQETCGTCHNESSIEPVSRVHQRAEFGDPGLVVRLSQPSVDGTTRKPSVHLRLETRAGQPLTRDATYAFNFVIARVQPAAAVVDNAPLAGPYVAYGARTATQQNNPDFPLTGDPRVVQQPAAERGTVFTQTGPGEYDYTFTAALPVGYDASASHIIAVYATRTENGVRFVGNATTSFVPNDGNATPLARTAVRTATCNGCHNPLSAHGGARQDVQVCLTCHSQGAVDPESNESIDFNIMIHKIHMGGRLPSVEAGGKYAIVGNGNNTYDFSHVEYPRDILHCQSCHTDADDERWVQNGTVNACTSCHENVYALPADGMGGRHPFALTGDPPSQCGNSNCHGPGGNAPDAREAHRTFLNTDSAPVFDLSLVSIEVASPEAAPTVRMRALMGTRATGAITPLTSTDQISRLDVYLNGPNQGFLLNGHDIKHYGKADVVSLTPDAANPGEFSFTLPESLSEAVSGVGDPLVDSYTLSLRGTYDPTPNQSPDNDRIDMLKNPTLAFTAAEDSAAAARAPVVSNDKCNSCHGALSAHGTGARNVEECIMCHTASFDTRQRQGASMIEGRTTSLRFSTMIHRIHAGSLASDPYIAYGFAAAPPYPAIDFSEREYPGDLRDCVKCHNTGTFTLPLPSDALPSSTVVLDGAGNVVGD